MYHFYLSAIIVIFSIIWVEAGFTPEAHPFWGSLPSSSVPWQCSEGVTSRGQSAPGLELSSMQCSKRGKPLESLTSAPFVTLCLSFFFSCRGLYEYELTLRPDMYTAKHTQWFYFRVRNMKAGANYRFTIVNLMKSSSLYSLGMRPLLYSERAARETSVGWQRTGSDIRYFRSCNQVDEPAVTRQRMLIVKKNPSLYGTLRSTTATR